ncbi:UNVERIFIED_CONTAM: hypothetical protein HDU68_010942 [Siphonaria sp. JEL0065]|nr:hypothetical protein HDU68_010942 [Siphonaria sp. JEL0065]
MPSYLMAIPSSGTPSTRHVQQHHQPPNYSSSPADSYNAIMDFYGDASSDVVSTLPNQQPTPPPTTTSSNVPIPSKITLTNTRSPQMFRRTSGPVRASSMESTHSSMFSRPYQSGSQAAFSAISERVLTGSEVSFDDGVDLVEDGEISNLRRRFTTPPERSPAQHAFDHSIPPETDMLPPSLAAQRVSVLRSPARQQPDYSGASSPVSSSINRSNIRYAPSSNNASRDVEENDTDSDDEAPLGLVGTQLQATSPPRPSFHQQQQSQPMISNILTSIANNSKVLDGGLENASSKEIESLEGLVGQLDLLLKSRKKEAAARSVTSKSASKPKLESLGLKQKQKSQKPESDSDGDDVPLGQIHSVGLAKVVTSPEKDHDDDVPLMSRVHTRNNAMRTSTPLLKQPFPEQYVPLSPQQPNPAQLQPTLPQAPQSQPVVQQQTTLQLKPEPKKVTTRIYIESISSYKTVILTNQLQADTVIAELICILGNSFVDDGSWTLFEVCSDFGIERPLRDWEIVTDVLEAWDPTTSTNVLILKPYGFRNTLVPRCIIGKWPRVEGRFDIEIKPGKWKRKYFVLKEDSIYYKDSEFDRENWLCRLNNFDVYTLTTPRKRATTQYCFALRSASSVTMFENTSEYIHFFCVDSKDQLADWVLGIRLAKVNVSFIFFAEVPTVTLFSERINFCGAA